MSLGSPRPRDNGIEVETPEEGKREEKRESEEGKREEGAVGFMGATLEEYQARIAEEARMSGPERGSSATAPTAPSI